MHASQGQLPPLSVALLETLLRSSSLALNRSCSTRLWQLTISPLEGASGSTAIGSKVEGFYLSHRIWRAVLVQHGNLLLNPFQLASQLELYAEWCQVLQLVSNLLLSSLLDGFQLPCMGSLQARGWTSYASCPRLAKLRSPQA